MYEAGVLYRKSATVNWCNDCQTVLANEQVVEGVAGDVTMKLFKKRCQDTM